MELPAFLSSHPNTTALSPNLSFQRIGGIDEASSPAFVVKRGWFLRESRVVGLEGDPIDVEQRFLNAGLIFEPAYPHAYEAYFHARAPQIVNERAKPCREMQVVVAGVGKARLGRARGAVVVSHSQRHGAAFQLLSPQSSADFRGEGAHCGFDILCSRDRSKRSPRVRPTSRLRPLR